MPQVGVGHARIRLQDTQPHEFFAPPSTDVDRAGGHGGEAQVHYLACRAVNGLEEDHRS